MTIAPTLVSEIYLFLILSAIVFLPGSALLVATGTWRRWQGLQRYIVAIGLSLAFFPILFYITRLLFPSVVLGPYVLATLLLLAAAVTGWGWWKWRAFTLKPASLEAVALVVLGLTFLSRLWIAHQYPFPAWSDSLHHTLLTQLTADVGRLPTTLEPYFPNTLEMYHLGLYALSGSADMLAQVPAHTALVWTAQFLNGLCGVGIYLLLDRFVGRNGAVVGLAVAGLFSVHPALWANWGRFTQLSSLVVLPIAWALTLEVLTINDSDSSSSHTHKGGRRGWLIVFAAMTTAAVFLFHFRVAIFYLLLLLPTVLIILWRAPSLRQRWTIIKSLSAIAILALLPILSVLWNAADLYFTARLAAAPQSTAAQRQELLQNYYRFPLNTIPHLAAPIWLLVISGLGGMVGLLRRNRIAAMILVWVVLLLLLGNAYLLEISWLNVTNLGAILIMAYLPIGLLTGIGIEEGLKLISVEYRSGITAILMTFLLMVSLPAARARAITIEPYRHFMTPADAAAMSWINENVPEDATFAINTYPWLPNFWHGTDAGYWIPYVTGRDIVTSAMLSDGLPTEYRQRIRARAAAAEALETELTPIDTLYDLGVEYIYIGARNDFSSQGLRADFLTQSARVELLYEQDGVAILRINAGE